MKLPQQNALQNALRLMLIITMSICIATGNIAFAQIREEITVLNTRTTNLSPVEKNGFLFSIEKSGNKSYILGTIHEGFSTEQNLGKNILDIVDKSSRIFLEVTWGENSYNLLKQNAKRRNEIKLVDLIGERYFFFFKHMFVDTTSLLTFEEYQTLQPWYVAMLIPIADIRTENISRWKFGTEAQLMDIAKIKKIPIEELEGVQLQAEVFNSMNDDYQSQYFFDYVNLVQDRSIYKREIEAIDAWTRSDWEMANRIFAQFSSINNAFAKFYFNHLIKQRNAFLAKKIVAFAEQNAYQFFAVGTDHLIGEYGILNLLEKNGFVIKRIY